MSASPATPLPTPPDSPSVLRRRASSPRRARTAIATALTSGFGATALVAALSLGMTAPAVSPVDPAVLAQSAVVLAAPAPASPATSPAAATTDTVSPPAVAAPSGATSPDPQATSSITVADLERGRDGGRTGGRR